MNELPPVCELPPAAAADGWRQTGNARNLGLPGGMDALARAMAGDCLLMLQDDCPLIADADATRRHLSAALDLLATGSAVPQTITIIRLFIVYRTIHMMPPKAIRANPFNLLLGIVVFYLIAY